jgi:HK97 family phage major capsid protein
MDQKSSRAAFLRYLARGAAAISSADAQAIYESRAVTGGSSGIAPQDWASFFTESLQTSWVLSRVRKVDVKTNKLTINHYTEQVETGDRLTSDEGGTRVDENGSFGLPRWRITDTAPANYDMNYESRAIDLHEVGVNMIVSRELIEEAIGNESAESVLRDFLVRKLQTELERQILVGDPALNTDSRKEMQGIWNYPLFKSPTSVYGEGNQVVDDANGAAGGAISGLPRLEIVSRIIRPSSYGNAVWVLARAASISEMFVTSSGGAAQTILPLAGISGSDSDSYGSLFNRPIYGMPYTNYQGEADATGDRLAMLVDLSKYVLAMHTTGFQVERLNEVRAATGQVVLRASVRVGGNMIDPKSLICLKAN